MIDSDQLKGLVEKNLAQHELSENKRTLNGDDMAAHLVGKYMHMQTRQI